MEREKYVEVVFKNDFYNEFTGRKYTYLDNDLDVEVGDIVAVNTYKGLSIAKVVGKSATCAYNGDLKCIESIVKTAKKDEEEKIAYEQKETRIREISNQAKKTKLLFELVNVVSKEDYEYLKTLNLEDIQKVYDRTIEEM